MMTTELPAHIRDAYTIWVCQCCLLVHANGECCPDDEHGGDGLEPLSALSPDDGLAMGMDTQEHSEDCEVRKQGTHSIEDYECDCERMEFSRSQCDGCNSYLHGERYAMTVFPGERKAR